MSQFIEKHQTDGFENLAFDLPLGNDSDLEDGEIKSDSVDGDAEQEQMGATIYPRTCQEDKHIRSTEQRIDTNDSVFESNSKSKLKIFISDKN